MQIGMNLPVMVPGLDRAAILDWARRIDAGPFSSLAAGERITFPNPEILVTLSAAAAVTERVKILPFVVVLPMHSELLVAKQIATLDVLSEGRVTLGVGVGARVEDYNAVGADFDRTRWSRLEEQVARMRSAWSGDMLVKGALRPIEPKPLQPGGPEILAGSLFPRSIRRAARWADGICGFSFGPDAAEIQASFELARDAWKQAGRDAPPRLVTGCWYALGPDAQGQMDAYLARYLNFMGEAVAKQLAKTVRTTSEESLREAIAFARDAGADEFVLTPTGADPDQLERVVDLIS